MAVTKAPKTRREREVWEACDELWEELCADGLPISKLTGEKLKEKLVALGYSRGNQGQIYQYRNSWQLSRGIEENDDLMCEERNALLSEKVQKAVELLFREIRTEAEEKISSIKDKTDNELKKFSDKYEILKKEDEALRNKLNEVSQELHIMQQANSELSSQLTKEKHDHDITKEKLNSAEAKYNQASIEAKKREQMLKENNEKDKKEAQSKIDGLISTYEKDLSILKEYSEKQRHQHIVEIENLKVANSKLDKQLEKIVLLEQKANKSNSELKLRIEALEDELEHSNKTYNDLVQKYHDVENILSGTKGELKQLQLLLSNQKEDFQNVNKQLLDYKERVGRLEEQLHQAQLEIQKRDKEI